MVTLGEIISLSSLLFTPTPMLPGGSQEYSSTALVPPLEENVLPNISHKDLMKTPC